MDKLVEREAATRTSLTAAPALAVQFFLIPLAVVGITILVYVGFRSLLTDQRSAQDYLSEVQSGGLARQWPAAFELSQLLDDPEKPWTPDVWSKINGWTDERNEAHISTIWALGASGDPAVVPVLQPIYASPDAGVRKIVVYALGALPGDQQIVTLRTALEDSVTDVRWN